MKKKVSLKDIAKKVGVSTATVSYVLSKGKDSRVSEEVSEKVKKAAKELNYQPNQIAKSLKMGKTFTIGLVVADISNPFFAHIARIIEDEAKKENYTVIFGSSDEKADKSWDLIQFLINRQVDGFIIAPTEGSEDQIRYLKENNIPFVLIDRYFPNIESSYVVLDNYQSAYNAIKRLVDTGNKKIGMIAYQTDLHHMEERVRGYEKALHDHKVEVKQEWIQKIEFDNIERDIRNGIDSLLNTEEPIEAIFFATNTLAVYGLKYLNELNYEVGKDLAIISFDEGEAFDFFYCPLTFLKQPLREIGQQAVRILTDHISGKKEVEQICLQAELIVRESCRTRQKS